MIRDVLPSGIQGADASEKTRGNPRGNDARDEMDAETAARAAANIAVWRAYLPEDCVEAMIRDGWHLST
jgi:hypothetical protein